MKFNQLSVEDQELLNTDFGAEIEKAAAAEAAVIQEMYNTGFNKLAADTADYLDKLAEEAKKEEDEEDEEEEKGEKKEASAEEVEFEKLAQELASFIERGYFDGLRKLGSERHDNEWHYLAPFVGEKIALVKEANKMVEGIKRMGSRAAAFAKEHPNAATALAGLGVTGALGGLSATQAGRESSKARAEAQAEMIADAKKKRKSNLGQYLFNPMVPGPLSESVHRLSRRHEASRAEHPMRTALIPGYGMLRGGEAGKKKIEK